MELNLFLRSVAEQDPDPIVICDLEHRIVYMNPRAVEQYANRGGQGLLGKRLLDCHNEVSCQKINQVLDWYRKSEKNNIVHTSYNPQKKRDTYMIAMRDTEGGLIGYYEKHIYRTPDETECYKLD